MKAEWLRLQEQDPTPDEVFHGLNDLAVRHARGSRELTAALALLAYLFEACDIFANPPPGGPLRDHSYKRCATRPVPAVHRRPDPGRPGVLNDCQWRLGGTATAACRAGGSGDSVSRDSRNCPVAVMRWARWWPPDLPSGGLQDCPDDQFNAFTPSPVRAWDRRTLSPLVWQRWAWWSSRSTVAVANVLGMSSSNPDGCRFELTATERRS